jgi:hypothetical protein
MHPLLDDLDDQWRIEQEGVGRDGWLGREGSAGPGVELLDGRGLEELSDQFEDVIPLGAVRNFPSSHPHHLLKFAQVLRVPYT